MNVLREPPTCAWCGDELKDDQETYCTTDCAYEAMHRPALDTFAINEPIERIRELGNLTSAISPDDYDHDDWRRLTGQDDYASPF